GYTLQPEAARVPVNPSRSSVAEFGSRPGPTYLGTVGIEVKREAPYGEPSGTFTSRAARLGRTYFRADLPTSVAPTCSPGRRPTTTPFFRSAGASPRSAPPRVNERRPSRSAAKQIWRKHSACGRTRQRPGNETGSSGS